MSQEGKRRGGINHHYFFLRKSAIEVERIRPVKLAAARRSTADGKSLNAPHFDFEFCEFFKFRIPSQEDKKSLTIEA